MRLLGQLSFGVAGVAMFATAAAALAGPHLPHWFARYFGALPPPLCLAVIGLIAIVIAPNLRKRGYWGMPRAYAILVVALLVACFAAVIITLDRLAGLPSDINAPLPWGLLYYPAMGFAAQIGLHLLPLAAIVWAAPNFSHTRPWTVMAMSSAPEAMLQALSAGGSTGIVVALHLLGFGVAELYLLRRFGFVAMYAFRLGYYLAWHIVWAAVRGG